jgi:hypothetical protein
MNVSNDSTSLTSIESETTDNCIKLFPAELPYLYSLHSELPNAESHKQFLI